MLPLCDSGTWDLRRVSRRLGVTAQIGVPQEARQNQTAGTLNGNLALRRREYFFEIATVGSEHLGETDERGFGEVPQEVVQPHPDVRPSGRRWIGVAGFDQPWTWGPGQSSRQF